MNRLHLTQDQLLDMLYGVAVSTEHLDECGECQARFQVLERRQDAMRHEQALPASFYHHQRRRILERLSEPVRPNFSPVWVPAAVAALMAVGLVLSRPVAPKPRPQVATTVAEIREAAFDEAEAGWFEDTYTEMQGSEPRALSPMRSLFSEGSVKQ